MKCCLAAGAVVAVVCFAASARAELPSPRFDRLSILGAGAGSTVEAEINANDTEGGVDLVFAHPGIKATPIEKKERWYQVTVAADVPLGTYDVRLVGRWGVSNPHIFAVTHGLKDVLEVEPNNEPEKAQVVEMNSAVNANSDNNNEDLFRIKLRSGERVLFD